MPSRPTVFVGQFEGYILKCIAIVRSSCEIVKKIDSIVLILYMCIVCSWVWYPITVQV